MKLIFGIIALVSAPIWTTPVFTEFDDGSGIGRFSFEPETAHLEGTGTLQILDEDGTQIHIEIVNGSVTGIREYSTPARAIANRVVHICQRLTHLVTDCGVWLANQKWQIVAISAGLIVASATGVLLNSSISPLNISQKTFM